LSTIEAQHLLDRMAKAFPVFTAWAEHVVDVGQLTGYLSRYSAGRCRPRPR
jgi:hypothetical protein